MSVGLIARWLFFTAKKAPKTIKRKMQTAIDKQIDRAVERNYEPTVIQENNTYNDIKILNQTNNKISL